VSECGNTDAGRVCTRPAVNHPLCTGINPATGEFENWPNPDYVEPTATRDPKGVREVKAKVLAATAPDERRGRFEEGMAASARSADRWTDAEKAIVVHEVYALCQAKAGGGEFTTGDVWARLEGRVPFTKGIASVMRTAQKNGWCELTGKSTTSTRTDEHGHGQTLKIWYSCLERSLPGG
jgi:hypothetical protein